MNEPEVVRGLLGWSNKRSGLEFYRWDEKIIPRHGSEWGDLLTAEPEIVGNEGSPVIVAVLPRSWSAAERSRQSRRCCAMPSDNGPSTKHGESLPAASSEAAWDEWVRLWATRDELAEWYADQLCEYGPNAPGWRQVNEAIVRRWSKSALVYIKTKAWKIAQAAPRG